SPDVAFCRVRLLTTTRGARNPKENPTAKNIRVALKEMLRGKTRHDTVLVALSGHGVQLEVKDPGGKGKDRFFPFFCPTDADLKAEVNHRTGEAATLINLDALFTDLGECGAGARLVLVDACRDEVRARNVDVRRVSIPDGVAALFSCGPGQRAWEASQ